ncbi:hypothetical protein T459_16847 [Capsicum annuum]|uniref:Terpene synthase metal-binding domain-containing protein n=1 Tax=Capsicum annuum TaxID=4072 RepID=A0A2G2ZA96_CAPAN|nr:hypothetical protein T459_16847 [Capsicum annuum]
MEELTTKETIEWKTNGPLITHAASTICRLMNDIADDHEVRHVASFVEFYIKEYAASNEDAYIDIQKKVMNAWKDINKEFLYPKVPYFILKRALSYARLADTFYKDGYDGYTNFKSKTKNMINLLFVESVNI